MRRDIGLLAAGVCAFAMSGVGCGKKPEEAQPSVPPVQKIEAPAPPKDNQTLLASWSVSPEQFEGAEGNPPKVAMTFDAGSDDTAVAPILKELAARKVRATFFLTGKFCEDYPDSCKAIADAGMELGNHSYSHPKFTTLSDEKIKEQLEKAEAAIVKACGRGTKPLFRYPYGDSDQRVRKAVAEAGYQAIYWSLDSLDSFGKPKSGDYVADRINRKIKCGNITLMHVSSAGSAAALPRIFKRLDKLKAQVVPVSELLLEKDKR